MNREEPFAKAFRANPAPMVVSELETGRFIDVNEQWVKLVGYTREEMLGRTSFDLGIWVDASARQRLVQALTTAGSAREVPASIRTKSGEIRELLWSVELISFGGPDVMLSLLYDVTEQRRVEATLRDSEERFKRLLENSNDIITVLDASGTELSAHGPVERVLGYQASELVGTNGLDYVHPDDWEAIREAFREALANPGSVQQVQYRFRRRDGTWITLESVGANLLDDPFVHGFVLNNRDITERVRLQEQLQQAMKMEAIGRLAGGVAHDFNNALTAIIGNTELASEMLDDPEVVAEAFREIQRAADSAASLTRQLLSFSRRQLIVPRVLLLSDLVQNLEGMLVRLLGADIELVTTTEAALGTVRVDPGQFEQVLVNLAVNARDAMPEGGRLAVATSNAELDEEYCATHPQTTAGRYVLLTVSDTGQGMSPEVQQRLFEPFFTTKPRGKGTGLGLATTFGVVKQAGGTIEVSSEVGRGTTFRIYLPRLDQPTEPWLAQAPAVGLVRGSERVLLVEDDRGVRESTSASLRRLGYEVLVASNATEGLASAAAGAPIQLLMTDVVMPGMNGRELAERIVELYPGTKVLFSSGYAEEIQRGVEGSVSFIGKPYSLRDLARKLREILDGKVAR